MSILTDIIIGLIMGVAAHYAAIMAIGNTLEKNKSLFEFVADLQARVYFCIAFTFLLWFVVGKASMFFIWFMAVYFITFLRLDFESVEKYYNKGKADL